MHISKQSILACCKSAVIPSDAPAPPAELEKRRGVPLAERHLELKHAGPATGVHSTCVNLAGRAVVPTRRAFPKIRAAHETCTQRNTQRHLCSSILKTGGAPTSLP